MKALIVTDTAAGHESCKSKFAGHFDSVTCVELRYLPKTLRTLAPPAPQLVVLDILRSPTKCLAVVARMRAVFPYAKVLVQKQETPVNFEYLAVQVGTHGVADIRSMDKSDIDIMLSAVLGGSVTQR